MSAAIEVFASKDTNAQVNQCWFSFTLLCMNIFLELLRIGEIVVVVSKVSGNKI